MDSLKIEQIELIILVGALVAVIARRLKIPYTAGLVLAGIGVAFLPFTPEASFSKDLLFNTLLPPLIFEAALYIRWRELKWNLPLIATYAVLGVLLSAAATATLMHFVTGWQWEAAILFGVLIAATDPVSVIAAFKEARVAGRLRLLVESESLFNDGTAAVGFTLALSIALGGSLGLASSILMTIASVFGGIASGLLLGGLALLIITRTEDDLVELAMTTVAAYGSFWLAEHFHFSGILAATTAGLLVGNMRDFGWITERGKSSIEHFWDFAAFVVNAVIFVLLGINVAYQDYARAGLLILVAVLAVLVGRAIAVYFCSLLFAGSRLRVKRPQQHVLVWGGLRGALALALALSIPDSLPYRQEILTVTFGVIAFSVFVQGMTIPYLLRYLKQIPAISGAGETTRDVAASTETS